MTPTVGRIVLYTPALADARMANGRTVKLAAIIAFVHSPILVNLTVFDANGNSHAKQRVPLVTAGTDTPEGHHCEWPPYQTKALVGGSKAATKPMAEEVDDQVAARATPTDRLMAAETSAVRRQAGPL